VISPTDSDGRQRQAGLPSGRVKRSDERAHEDRSAGDFHMDEMLPGRVLVEVSRIYVISACVPNR